MINRRRKQLGWGTVLTLVGMVCLLFVAAVPAADSAISPDMVSQIASTVIAESIPREYERTKDWGKTKRITTGVRSSGNFFEFDIHRKKKEVKHGVWTKYRMTLVEPEKNLDLRIENMRNVGPGRIAMTLFVTTKLDGWARTRIYERGIHVISVEAQGNTKVRLWLHCEIAFESVSSNGFVPGLAIRPVVKDARLKLDDFRLERISDVRGSIAHEIGDGLKRVIEDELSGEKLVAKLNKSIEKRRDRLELSPDKLLGFSAARSTAGEVQTATQ